MQLIHELERTRAETLSYFSLDDRDLGRTYAPGNSSATSPFFGLPANRSLKRQAVQSTEPLGGE
jgi:hypothetical protein